MGTYPEAPAERLQASLLDGAGGGGERMGIDEMLRRHAGEFGWWQARHFVLASFPWMLEAMHAMVIIFADRTVSGADSPGASTVSEWGLVGKDKYKVGLAQSAFFAGCMLGAGVFGHLSDSFLGRKGSLIVVCILNTIFGLLTALSPGYWVYVVLRTLTGFSTGGVGLCAFVLATEPVGPNKRGVAGMSTFYFFSGGIALLSGIAYIVPAWRALYVVTSLPSLLYLLLVLPFISESPRWYLVRRRTNEAMEVMRAIAKSNGRHIPSNATLMLDDEEDSSSGKNSEDVVEQAVSGSIIDVLRSPLTRMRLVLTVGINFVSSIVYYGISLNVVNLKTNLYLNVFLNAVSEMPAFVLTALLIDRFGRKPMGIGTMWLSGAACMVGTVLGGEGTVQTARMVCGIVGIFGMAATYNLLYIYTAELFPTVVRNAALGCASQAAQFGAILAPMVVVLGESLPFAVFAVCGIIGGLLMFFLPETMNKPLYDTMAGMEDAESKFVA